MNGQTPANADPPRTPEDIDLYCLNCGYNLRGLSGDPRRCPECGEMNPIGDIELPAELISRQLRRMETWPAVCVGSVLVVVVLLTLLLLVLVEGEPYDEEFLCCTSLFAGLAMLLWWIGMAQFRNSCLGKPGWRRALGRYHFYGLLMSVAVFAAIATVPILTYCVRPGALSGSKETDRLVQLLVGLVVLIGMGVAILIGGRGACRRAKGDMETLQRKVAVDLARERLRRELRHQRRGGIFGGRGR